MVLLLQSVFCFHLISCGKALQKLFSLFVWNFSAKTWTIFVLGAFIVSLLVWRRGLRDQRKDTNHIQRHDDHEVDADSSAWGGELPVLLHKLPLEGSKLLHGNEPEHHHGKHGCQDQRDLEGRWRDVNEVSNWNIINRWIYIGILQKFPFTKLGIVLICIAF